MTPPMTVRLYGGQDGNTLYPPKTYYRPAVPRRPASCVRDVAVLVAWATVAWVWFVVAVTVMA